MMSIAIQITVRYVLPSCRWGCYNGRIVWDAEGLGKESCRGYMGVCLIVLVVGYCCDFWSWWYPSGNWAVVILMMVYMDP